MDAHRRDALAAEVSRGGQASVRNLALAEAAVLRGQFNVAKVLRALAHTQRVQALAAARLLTHDIDPAETLRVILAELENASPRDTTADGTVGVRERAQDIACRALASIAEHSDVTETDVAQALWGCHGCGYLAEGDRPDACSVCGALAPEFAWFGPFYSSTPEHLGQLRPAAILAILEAVPDEVEAAITGVEEARLRHKPSPPEWSAMEIAGHMLETDRLFAHRVRVMLGSEGIPTIDTPVPPWKLHEGQGYEALPVREVLGRLRQTRAESVALVRGLTPEDWARRATFGGTGTTVLDLGTWLANHDRGHLAQIRQLTSS